jgi:hypothetical protein
VWRHSVNRWYRQAVDDPVRVVVCRVATDCVGLWERLTPVGHVGWRSVEGMCVINRLIVLVVRVARRAVVERCWVTARCDRTRAYKAQKVLVWWSVQSRAVQRNNKG